MKKNRIQSHFISVLIFTYASLGLADQSTKIIGENDLVLVKGDSSNIPVRYRALVDAFGLMSNSCTATHIGGGYVLSAGHCFWAFEKPTVNESCSDTTIEWGIRDGKPGYMTSKCDRIVIAQRFGMNDFALIKVSPIPPVAIAPDLSRRPIIGDTVTVFSHPDDQPLFWSGDCGIERLQHPDLALGTIQHKCDTNPGSSGATLINVLSLKVVGIHDGGFDGKPEVDPKNPDSAISTGMNYGTFIMNSPLKEALEAVGFH